jgi:hypothetical protein
MTLTPARDLETSSSQAEVAPPELQPRISLRWALRPRHVVIVAVWCFVWLLLCYLPLSGIELWRMVSYGHWMLVHGQLPVEDPFMPLARGMPLVRWCSWIGCRTSRGAPWPVPARPGSRWFSPQLS